MPTTRPAELDDRDWLVERYVGQDLTAAQIAREIACDKATVLRALRRHGITARPAHGRGRQRQSVFPGDRFGRLTVIERDHANHWLCVCDCGARTIARTSPLRSGATRSCGCLARETAAKNAVIARQSVLVHGHGRKKPSPTYFSWNAMLSRCTYPGVAGYHLYGGRGITVCDRWRTFTNFLADMGPRPEGHTLDRIDPDGNYEPGNCRWATPKEQRANQRVAA